MEVKVVLNGKKEFPCLMGISGDTSQDILYLAVSTDELWRYTLSEFPLDKLASHRIVSLFGEFGENMSKLLSAVDPVKYFELYPLFKDLDLPAKALVARRIAMKYSNDRILELVSLVNLLIVNRGPMTLSKIQNSVAIKDDEMQTLLEHGFFIQDEHGMIRPPDMP